MEISRYDLSILNIKILSRDYIYKYCGRISQSGHIKTYKKQLPNILFGTQLVPYQICRSNKNRISNKFQGHIFDIKHTSNTAVARHFHSHNDQLDAKMTIHILEYIKLPRDIPRSNSLRDKRELVLIHRLNTLIPSGLSILDRGN